MIKRREDSKKKKAPSTNNKTNKISLNLKPESGILKINGGFLSLKSSLNSSQLMKSVKSSTATPTTQSSKIRKQSK